MRRVLFTLLACLLLPVSAQAGLSKVEPKEETTKSYEGFFDLKVDRTTNTVQAILPKPGKDGVILKMIHTVGLRAGLGSNPLGLDRGWWRGGEILVVRKIGDKIILEVENTKYRAKPDNPLEVRAVKDSFATSFIASAPYTLSGDRIVIDMTPFLTSDVLDLTDELKEAKQGSFTVAKDRTLVDTSNILVFPDNVEIDVFLTLAGSNTKSEVSTTTANGKDVTLVQHHSFVRLPDDGYETRKSDPRTGVIDISYYDYSAALDEPIETRLARRFRLEKDENGKTKNPIIFYIDPGAPEPIRSALVEGAKWWEDAFAAAGFPDGYRVELLPEDAHPMDIRYNVVQWVHRQTRGWSYGGGISDPRTGEMLKGQVILGSLRVRQDRMIFEGLAGTANTGTGAKNDPVELSLARIRQLSAHEIGHSLGFAHNFAASTYGRASVMDYPAPDVRVKDGKLDFSHAYGVGVGSWDKFAATWLYADMDDKQREALVRKSIKDGLVYVKDSDARSISTGHPRGNIWDNGKDPVEELKSVMAVRRIALDAFGPDRIAKGQPVADLNSVIVPIYLYHRYQVAAAGKKIGGMDFNYALRGDGQPGAKVVPADEQREALNALLKTIQPSELDLRNDVIALLTPTIDRWGIADSKRELFKQTAYPAFDVITAADTAADMTFDVLMDEKRVARVIEFNRRDANQLGMTEVLARITEQVLSPVETPREQKIAAAITARYAQALMKLHDSAQSTAVKASAYAGLHHLKVELSNVQTNESFWLTNQIESFLKRPATPIEPKVSANPLPPGGPIGGMTQYETCWHCE